MPVVNEFLVSELKYDLDTIADGLSLRFDGCRYSSKLEGEDRIFVSDYREILTATRNLLSNAFKFRDPTRVNHVELTLSSSVSSLEIIVKDEGVGIKKEDYEVVLEKFKRIEHDTYHYEGTGIGLNLVSQIVANISGDLTIESRLGEGTRFKLSFEALSAKAPRFQLQKDTRVREASLEPILDEDRLWSVCIVDDNPTNCEIFSKALSSDKLAVNSFTSANQAMSFVKDHSVDLIILDVMMPEMNEKEFLSLLRSDPDLIKIPVIMVTARSSKEDHLESLKLGAADYLSKPVILEELTLRVSRLIERQSLIAERYRSFELLDKQIERNEKNSKLP